MRTILLIRHGESKANAGTDEPSSCTDRVELTDKGWQQAYAIAHFLADEAFPDLIITSSFLRAEQTAIPAGEQFQFAAVDEWNNVHEFTYLCSDCDPHRLITIEKMRLQLDDYWNTCRPFSTGCQKPSPTKCTKSESFAMFIERAQNVLLRLKQTPYETIALFSHEQFIRALLWIAGGEAPVNAAGQVVVTPQSMEQFRDILRENRVPNGAIIRVQFSENDERWQPEMITSHLEELPVLVAAGV